MRGSQTDKLRFLFQVYDVDGKVMKNGFICGFFPNQVAICKAAWFCAEHPSAGIAAVTAPLGFGTAG